MTENEPIVRVGIMTASSLTVTFDGDYRDSSGNPAGGLVRRFEVADAAVETLIFTPASDGDTFRLNAVPIGKGFHWERPETQHFSGALMIRRSGSELTAINILGVEQYLTSVISSEMSAEASLEFLKAHAIISRSWVMAMLGRNDSSINAPDDRIDTPDELVTWRDREDHTDFDVCADDHCQRYQGITRVTRPEAAEAVRSTRGCVLTYGDEICDARFSKCCGGAFEQFESCWEPVSHPYLAAAVDAPPGALLPDLRREAQAEQWIMSLPRAYCNTRSPEVMRQVMNDYDCETSDFYRWHMVYTADQIAELLKRRTGIDFGRIIDLKVHQRGTSGRIIRLEVIGTLRRRIIGKELEIRRCLSDSHLLSSAFVVERREIDCDGVPASWVLHGAGWGHGVGLCQIGAAMMSLKGHTHSEILAHYYHGSTVKKLY